MESTRVAGPSPGMFSMGLLSPEEQVAMMAVQQKVAMSPTEMNESQARQAANLAQAQMLTGQANKLGMQMPIPTRLPNGQIVNVDPQEAISLSNSLAQQGLERQRIAIAGRQVAIEEALQDPRIQVDVARASALRQEYAANQEKEKAIAGMASEDATLARVYPPALSKKYGGGVDGEAKSEKVTRAKAIAAAKGITLSQAWDIVNKQGEDEYVRELSQVALVNSLTTVDKLPEYEDKLRANYRRNNPLPSESGGSGAPSSMTEPEDYNYYKKRP